MAFRRTTRFTRLMNRLRRREAVVSRKFKTDTEYVTGTGQVLYHVHPETSACHTDGCVIHAPSPDAEAIGPTYWRQDRQMMERICKHGIGHPDPDGARWALRKFGFADTMHGCDGCCCGLAFDEAMADAEAELANQGLM